MRIDVYTKIVLTTIATCLLWLCLGRLAPMPPVHAQTPQKPLPTLITSKDFGFRVDGWRPGEAPVGTLVVQIDGASSEAHLHYVKP
jgi:hypothetical protein